MFQENLQFKYFSHQEGRIIQLEDGAYVEILCDGSEDAVIQNEPNNTARTGNYCCDINKLNVRFDMIESQLKTLNAVIMQVMDFAANVDKFMKLKRHQTIIPTKSQHEDFAGCKDFLAKMQSKQELQLLESKLQNAAFKERLIRYCRTVYNLTGKRDGKAFFRTFMREVISPKILQPYSWKGNSRMMKNMENLHAGQNESFKRRFPNFVEFVHLVAQAADFEFTEESNAKAFSDFLRQKKTELLRFETNNANRRTSSSRKRKMTTSDQAVLGQNGSKNDLWEAEKNNQDTNGHDEIAADDEDTVSEAGSDTESE